MNVLCSQELTTTKQLVPRRLDPYFTWNTNSFHFLWCTVLWFSLEAQRHEKETEVRDPLFSEYAAQQPPFASNATICLWNLSNESTVLKQNIDTGLLYSRRNVLTHSKTIIIFRKNGRFFWAISLFLCVWWTECQWNQRKFCFDKKKKWLSKLTCPKKALSQDSLLLRKVFKERGAYLRERKILEWKGMFKSVVWYWQIAANWSFWGWVKIVIQSFILKFLWECW